MTPAVFVSIPHGGCAGNVLRSGLISRVLEADAAADIVVCSPLVNDPAFVREFEQPRVRFEELPPHRPAGLEARWAVTGVFILNLTSLYGRHCRRWPPVLKRESANGGSSIAHLNSRGRLSPVLPCHGKIGRGR